MHEDNIIMKGTRNQRDGLYDISINKTMIQEKNYLLLELKTIPSINSVSLNKTLSNVPCSKSVLSHKKIKAL